VESQHLMKNVQFIGYISWYCMLTLYTGTPIYKHDLTVNK